MQASTCILLTVNHLHLTVKHYRGVAKGGGGALRRGPVVGVRHPPPSSDRTSQDIIGKIALPSEKREKGEGKKRGQGKEKKKEKKKKRKERKEKKEREEKKEGGEERKEKKEKKEKEKKGKKRKGKQKKRGGGV